MRPNASPRAYEIAKLRGLVVTGKDMSEKYLAELLVRSPTGMARRAVGRTGPLLFAISAGGVSSKLI